MTEIFPSAWGDEEVPYLQAFPDLDGPAPFALPLDDEENATAFIEGSPPAYCNTTDRALLEKVLPELDHGTTRFYRWEEAVPATQVRKWVQEKAGVDLGPVTELRPLQRGPSGRLIRLEIVGEQGRLRVGKELEIRRLLSKTHLYSSAFVAKAEGTGEDRVFRLRGAGWGHGVGLCQIGAAVMADQGHGHESILAHYYRGAALERRY
jgi:SpoIID/LytB domain protein